MENPASYDELVTLLSTAIGNRKLYFGDHPRVASCTTRFITMLGELLATDGKESFFLGIVDGSLVESGRFLIGPTIVGRRLVEFGEKLCSGGFLFRDGTESDEISRLIDLAAELKEPATNLAEARRLLHDRDIRTVEISPVYQDPGWFGQFLFDGTEDWGTRSTDRFAQQAMLPVYQGLYDTVEGIQEKVAEGGDPDVGRARETTGRLLEAAKGNFMDVMQLVRYPDYDSYTVGHSVRVAMIAALVAHHMGVSAEIMLEIGTAGLMHDVGKARIPEEILYKPGRLTDAERKVVEGHTLAGAEMLLAQPESTPLTVAVAWGHHQRHDGRGYPAGESWSRPGPITGLMHICDVFEALTALRPYKEALSPRRALEIMLQDRGSFHPGLMGAFIRAMGIYPPGSRVRLSTGEEGLVLAAGEALDRPSVRVTHDKRGLRYPEEEERDLDLAEPADRPVAIIGQAPDQRTRS